MKITKKFSAGEVTLCTQSELPAVQRTVDDITTWASVAGRCNMQYVPDFTSITKAAVEIANGEQLFAVYNGTAYKIPWTIGTGECW